MRRNAIKWAFGSLVLLCACNTEETLPPLTHLQPLSELSFTAEAAEDWTALFHRTSGWFGADGIFSIPPTGVDTFGHAGNHKSLFIFSDTYIGEVEDGKPLPGNTMVHNTMAYIRGTNPHPDSVSFHYQSEAKGAPTSFFSPTFDTAAPKRFFWMGDGFVNQEKENTLYFFAYHVEFTGANVFDFIEPNVSILAIPKGEEPNFKNYRQLKTPLHVKLDSLGEGNLGAGIHVNTKWAGAPNPDGYVYVYGCIGKDKSLVVSRVKPADFENFSEWQYWDGKAWSDRPESLAAVTNAASNELSVTPLKDGRFLLVFQVMGLSDKVGIRIGESPIGPFGEIHEVWRTPEIDQGLFPYNAKAHPHLSPPGELLISYNTITPDFWVDIQNDAHIYRPRFIRVKIHEK